MIPLLDVEQQICATRDLLGVAFVSSEQIKRFVNGMSYVIVRPEFHNKSLRFLLSFAGGICSLQHFSFGVAPNAGTGPPCCRLCAARMRVILTHSGSRVQAGLNLDK